MMVERYQKRAFSTGWLMDALLACLARMALFQTLMIVLNPTRVRLSCALPNSSISELNCRMTTLRLFAGDYFTITSGGEP